MCDRRYINQRRIWKHSITKSRLATQLQFLAAMSAMFLEASKSQENDPFHHIVYTITHTIITQVYILIIIQGFNFTLNGLSRWQKTLIDRRTEWERDYNMAGVVLWGNQTDHRGEESGGQVGGGAGLQDTKALLVRS